MVVAAPTAGMAARPYCAKPNASSIFGEGFNLSHDLDPIFSL